MKNEFIEKSKMVDTRFIVIDNNKCDLYFFFKKSDWCYWGWDGWIYSMPNTFDGKLF